MGRTDRRITPKLIYWTFFTIGMIGPNGFAQVSTTRMITGTVSDTLRSVVPDSEGRDGGSTVCDGRSFGTKGDRAHVDALAIQIAIQACADRGGGIVRFGAGTYFSGSIQLKNNFTVPLEQGADLVASPDVGLYSGLNVRNSLLVPNADAMSVSNSQGVHISDVYLEVGDDGNAISPCADGNCSQTAENIPVSNTMIDSRSAAIRIGWSAEDIRDLVFNNIIIRDTNRGIGISVRGKEKIENVLMSNIIIETRLMDGSWGVWANRCMFRWCRGRQGGVELSIQPSLCQCQGDQPGPRDPLCRPPRSDTRCVVGQL